MNIFLHQKIENKLTSTILILIKRLVGGEHMADGSTVQKVDRSLVVTIVRSYVAKNSVPADQLGGLITTVHRTLSGLGANAPPKGSPDAGCPYPAIGAAGPCRLPGMWISQPNSAPPPAGAAQPRCRRLSGALAIVAGSSGDGTGLFGAPLGNGEAARPRPPVGSERGTGRAKAARTPAADVDELVKTAQ